MELPVDATWGPQPAIRRRFSIREVRADSVSSRNRRLRGLEAFDLDMNYVGKVHTGSGHGDFVRDSSGTEWAVIDNANNAYLFSGAHYIVKAKIPSGVIFDAAGNVDVKPPRTLD